MVMRLVSFKDIAHEAYREVEQKVVLSNFPCVDHLLTYIHKFFAMQMDRLLHIVSRDSTRFELIFAETLTLTSIR